MISRSVMIISVVLAGFGVMAATSAAPADSNSLAGKRVAIMTADGFQDAEVLVPLAYLANRGAVTTVIGIQQGLVKAYNNEMTAVVQKPISAVDVKDLTC